MSHATPSTDQHLSDKLPEELGEVPMPLALFFLRDHPSEALDLSSPHPQYTLRFTKEATSDEYQYSETLYLLALREARRIWEQGDTVSGVQYEGYNIDQDQIKSGTLTEMTENDCTSRTCEYRLWFSSPDPESLANSNPISPDQIYNLLKRGQLGSKPLSNNIACQVWKVEEAPEEFNCSWDIALQDPFELIPDYFSAGVTSNFPTIPGQSSSAAGRAVLRLNIHVFGEGFTEVSEGGDAERPWHVSGN